MKRFSILAFTIAVAVKGDPVVKVRMRPVEELISADSAWSLVKSWVGSAKNRAEILDRDPVKAREALFQLQVTTRSPMGAIVYESGGILINGGEIRILGSGSAKLNRSLPQWNRGKTFKETGERPSFLLIADDVYGGFFALNGGGLSASDPGAVFAFDPRSLTWTKFAPSYSDFLYGTLNGDLAARYRDMKWKGSEAVVTKVPGDKSLNFYPPLFSKEGADLSKVSVAVVPVDETWSFETSVAAQLSGK